jgi:hypothetical protein
MKIYRVIKGCLLGQDGNQGYEEEVIGEFETERDAIDFIAVQQHNGWLSYDIEEFERI